MSSNLSFLFELSVNLFQGIVFTVFINTFLTPRFKKSVNIAVCAFVSLLMFLAITIINQMYSGFAKIEIPVFMLIMIPFSVFCHKGKLHIKIFLPVIIFAIFMCIAMVYSVIVSSLFNNDIERAITLSSVYRYIYLFIFNATFIFVLFMIRRIFKNRIDLKKPVDIFTCVIIPTLTMVIVFLATAVISDESTTEETRIYLGIIALIAFIIVFSMFHVMREITKAADLRAVNLVMAKEQEMYKSEISNQNKYIDEISHAKHEIRRKLSCIDGLIKSGNPEQAAAVCEQSVAEIDEIDPLYRTGNIFLDYILGVAHNKAADKNIQCRFTVKSNLDGIDGCDLLSLLGNLTDNALEAMSNIESDKLLQITAFEKEHYYIISVKNTTRKDVIKSNPSLASTKQDKKSHGHGLEIVRNVVEKYNGNINFTEHNGMFDASLMLEK